MKPLTLPLCSSTLRRVQSLSLLLCSSTLRRVLVASLLIPLLASCDKADLDSSNADLGQNPELTKEITFNISTFEMSQEPLTRASTNISATPTRLLVLDVVDGTVKQTLERTTGSVQEGSALLHTDNVLSNLSLTLTYGTHDIYLLAAVTPYDSCSTTGKKVIWSVANRPSYTWAKKVSVSVSQASAGSQSVELPLVIGRVDLVCNDAQDPAATKMQISGSMLWTLDLVTMKGVAPDSLWNYTISVPNTTAGRTFGAYSFEPSTGNIGTMTFKALKADGTEIVSHSLSEVPVTAGYITNYTGNFYSNIPTFSLTTTNQWTGITQKTY